MLAQLWLDTAKTLTGQVQIMKSLLTGSRRINRCYRCRFRVFNQSNADEQQPAAKSVAKILVRPNAN